MKTRQISDGNIQRFVQLPLHSALAREGSLCAARMIEAQRWHSRLLDRDGIRDHDVFALLGLEVNRRNDKKIVVADVRTAVAEQLCRLERYGSTSPDRLTRNISKLGDILKVNSTERAVLRLAVIATRVKYFDDFLRITLSGQWELVRAVSHAIRRRPREVLLALSNNSALRRSGFFEYNEFHFNRHNPLCLDKSVADALLAHQFDEERFLRRLYARESPHA